MAVLECKICGGSLIPIDGTTTAECDSCGRVQPIPAADNEKKISLFTRANRLRATCEFDKAAGIYETLVSDFPQEAEAYWGLVLCKYGIEYVDDPAGVKVPTCHRSSFDSILDDADYAQALDKADVVARKLYREEAQQLEEIRKGIISVSANEEPYDIFICYKETGFDGERTEDSVEAQDLYDELTAKGYRVFFSRITLEDKLGTEYEPYIFAALNSAKIMLAVGFDDAYFNAVWVKNEWSRFLKLMAKDKEKHLIPCFKGIDPEDMPKEFRRLQSQDLGKIGSHQDLIRAIGKLLPKEKEPVQERVMQNPGGIQASTLAKRGMMALADGEWKNAEKFFEEALNHDAEYGEAYLGKFLTAHHSESLDQLAARKNAEYDNAEITTMKTGRNSQWEDDMVTRHAVFDLSTTDIYDMLPDAVSYSSKVAGTQRIADGHTSFLLDRMLQRAKTYTSGSLRSKIEAFINTITERDTQAINDAKAGEAEALAAAQGTYRGYMEAAEDDLTAAYEEALTRQENHYQNLCKNQETYTSRREFEQLTNAFRQMGNYKDCQDRHSACASRVHEMLIQEETARKEKAEADRLAKEKARLAAEAAKRRAKMTKIGLKIAGVLGVIGAIVGLVVFVILLFTTIIPGNKYKKAEELYAAGKYVEAADQFFKCEKYKDSRDRIYGCAEAMAEHDMAGYAAIYFGKLEDHKDAHTRSMELWTQVTDRTCVDESINGTLVAIKEDGTLIISQSWLENVYGTADIAETPAGTINNAVAVTFVGDADIAVLLDDGAVDVLCSHEGNSCAVRDMAEKWTDIVDIVGGQSSLIALDNQSYIKQVTSDNSLGNTKLGGCAYAVDLAAGYSKEFVAAVLADGTVWTSGAADNVAQDVATWTDIVALDVGDCQIAGLKKDGTVVVSCSDDSYNQMSATEWTDIVDVACRPAGIYGLKPDGSIVCTSGLTFSAPVASVHIKNETFLFVTTNGTLYGEKDNPYTQWTNIKIGGKSITPEKGEE